MSVDFESLSDVLKHSMRRRILLVLYERKNLSYIDLMDLVGATNTGKRNYHLKILGDLIEKDQNGKHVLYTADAALIGFAGATLTVVNPVFWGSFLVILLKSDFNVTFV